MAADRERERETKVVELKLSIEVKPSFVKRLPKRLCALCRTIGRLLMEVGSKYLNECDVMLPHWSWCDLDQPLRHRGVHFLPPHEVACLALHLPTSYFIPTHRAVAPLFALLQPDPSRLPEFCD